MKKLAFAAIILTFILFGWTILYDRKLKSADPTGYRNIKTCLRLKPGIAEGELRAALGEPTRRERHGGGGERLEFQTLSAAAAPIRADIDSQTGKVLALWCTGDDLPTWRTP